MTFPEKIIVGLIVIVFILLSVSSTKKLRSDPPVIKYSVEMPDGTIQIIEAVDYKVDTGGSLTFYKDKWFTKLKTFPTGTWMEVEFVDKVLK